MGGMLLLLVVSALLLKLKAGTALCGALGTTTFALVTSKGAFLYALDGRLLLSLEGRFSCVSYCCSLYAFSGEKKTVIVTENGIVIKTLKVGRQYVGLLGDRVLLCGEDCVLYTLNGKYLVGIYLDYPAEGKPAIALPFEEVVVPEGKVTEALSLPSLDGKWTASGGRAVAYCGTLLVIADTSLRLYYLSKDTPHLLWERALEGYAASVSFSSDCSTLAVAVGKRLIFYDALGRRLNAIEFNSTVTFVDWKDERMLVGTEDGVYLFGTRLTCKPTTTTLTETKTVTVTKTVYTSLIAVTIIK